MSSVELMMAATARAFKSSKSKLGILGIIGQLRNSMSDSWPRTAPALRIRRMEARFMLEVRLVSNFWVRVALVTVFMERLHLVTDWYLVRGPGLDPVRYQFHHGPTEGESSYDKGQKKKTIRKFFSQPDKLQWIRSKKSFLNLDKIFFIKIFLFFFIYRI